MNDEPITINLTIPEGWSQLSDRDLLFVYRLIAAEMNADQLKLLCLMRWAGLKYRHRYGDDFVLRHGKIDFVVTAVQLAELLPFFSWLDEPAQEPRLLSRIGRHRPFAADFTDVAFEKYIVCDNLFQGYLATQRDCFLLEMASVAYGHRFKSLRPEEAISIFFWFVALKDYLARRYSNFFRAATPDVDSSNLLGLPQADPRRLQDTVNIMLRALTKGDITKTAEIIALDTHLALTELDAQAREYHELNSKIKS